MIWVIFYRLIYEFMLATWRRTIAKCSRAFTTIAKQAMPFGDRLSLQKAKAISGVLYRLICWRLGDEQLLSVREHFLQSRNLDWRFGDLLSLNQKR